MWRIMIMAIMCVQLVSCSAATDLLGKVGIGSSTPITAAVAKCKLTDYIDEVKVVLNDDGHSLILLNDSLNAGTVCVMRELGIPVYINYLMSLTRDIDGMQQEEFEGYKIYWSYGSWGLNIIIHMT